MAARHHANSTALSRRALLRSAGGLGVGLLIGFAPPGVQADTPGVDRPGPGFPSRLHPFVRVDPDGVVTVISKNVEMGQGSPTGLALLVAEELDADWAKVRVETAPVDPERFSHLFAPGVQVTAGSSSMAQAWTQYRLAGATARALLVAAAGLRWGVPDVEIAVVGGRLEHPPTGRTLAFGDVAEAAAALPVPERVSLKEPGRFRLVGRSDLRRLDSPAKLDGSALYTQDVRRPGMLTAVVARPPRFGGRVRGVDASTARAVAGVVDVVTIPQGVAVLAADTWAALRGREALRVDWDDAAAEMRGTDELRAAYRALLDEPGSPAATTGDASTALAGAGRVIEADFDFPFLAHAPMEPMNAVVDLVPGRRLTVWTGAQMPSVDRLNAARVAGIEPSNVVIHCLDSGGSFGRRAVPSSDYVVEAVEIAKAIEGRAPVKLVWSRDDDIRGGHYRPMYLHRVRAGLDASGRLVAWQHRIVGQSIQATSPFRDALVKDGVDVTSVEGAANLPYAVENLSVDLHSPTNGVPVLWWRSVGSSHTAYATEVMMDWLARAANRDPLAFRLDHLGKHPRHQAVLRLAADRAGWDRPAPPGLHRGLAVHESFGTVVAQVAEVRLRADGTVKVERVVCAVDCGRAVMPDQVTAQMEGGIGFGLGAALRNEVTLTKGVVDQSQFHDYEPLRITDMPRVEVHIVPSDGPPTGVGEPGTPVIAPAVANAVHAATGRRLATLPLSRLGLT